LQTLDWHFFPPVHPLAQVPQCPSSDVRFAQDPEHSWVPGGQPRVHAKLAPDDVDAAQTGWLPPHCMVQSPQ
jgi:hypothetical protein